MGLCVAPVLLCTRLPFGFLEFPPVAGSVARPNAALRETLECTLEQLVTIRGEVGSRETKCWNAERESAAWLGWNCSRQRGPWETGRSHCTQWAPAGLNPTVTRGWRHASAGDGFRLEK